MLYVIRFHDATKINTLRETKMNESNASGNEAQKILEFINEEFYKLATIFEHSGFMITAKALEYAYECFLDELTQKLNSN